MNRRVAMLALLLVVGAVLSRAGAAAETTDPKQRSSDPKIRYQQDQRASYGLDSSEDKVRKLDAQGNNAGLGRFGVLLDDTEFADVAGREERGAEAYRLRDAARTYMSATYGGSYMDQLDHGRIKVLVTEHDPARETLVKRSYRWPDQVDFVVVSRPYSGLEQTQDNVMNDIDDLRAQGIDITGTAILEQRNVVEIHVARMTNDTDSTLRDRYGDGVEALETGRAQALNAAGP